MDKIKLGISSCLLGNAVRYDGSHKLDRFLRDTMGRYVEYIAVCPEVECGMGVPREALRLEGNPAAPRLVTSQTRKDKTQLMISWAQRRLPQLAYENICGFIFKSGSPSSGMERVTVYDDRGMPSKAGAGIFARLFVEYFPLLPVEDEERLHNLEIRENFIARLFTLNRWRNIKNAKSSRSFLVDFHTRHKFLILSHSFKHYTAMGKLVATPKKLKFSDLISEYEMLLMEAMKLKSTLRKNTNVLQHITGYFKKVLSPDEKKEMLEIIDQYKRGLLPLIVPVTLINHYARRYEQKYLKDQIYLSLQHPELQMRNHV